jgi:hypothetical protein
LRTCEKLLTTSYELADVLPCKDGHLQAQRNIAITVLVVLLKHIRHAFQRDTRLHKQIKTECITPVAVVCAVQQRDELLRQAVSKGNQSFVELGVRYAAAMVLVEAVEEVAPCGEEAPEAAEGVLVGKL